MSLSHIHVTRISVPYPKGSNNVTQLMMIAKDVIKEWECNGYITPPGKNVAAEQISEISASNDDNRRCTIEIQFYQGVANPDKIDERLEEIANDISSAFELYTRWVYFEKIFSHGRTKI